MTHERGEEGETSEEEKGKKGKEEEMKIKCVCGGGRMKKETGVTGQVLVLGSREPVAAASLSSTSFTRLHSLELLLAACLLLILPYLMLFPQLQSFPVSC